MTDYSMNISEAIELMKWTTPKSPSEMVEAARLFLRYCKPDAPLRLKVACDVIIREMTIPTKSAADIIRDILEHIGDDASGTVHLGPETIRAMRAAVAREDTKSD